MRSTDFPVPTPFFELEASAKSTLMKGIFRFLADFDFQYLLFREPKRPKGLFGKNDCLCVFGALTNSFDSCVGETFSGIGIEVELGSGGIGLG